MQNAKNSGDVIPHGLCASEMRMLLDAAFIPDFMQRSIGGELCEATRCKWDAACKEYYEKAMGSPPGMTWHDVHVPFGMSLDNAPVHQAWRKEVLVPRVPVVEEFRALFEHAEIGLNFNIKQEVAAAADEVITHYNGVASRAHKNKNVTRATRLSRYAAELRDRYEGAKIYVMGQFQDYPFVGEHKQAKQQVTLAIFDIVNGRYNVAREAYRQEHGVDWVSVFRREQALIDARWLCLLPEQFMPLGNTTPDLHQCAELLVGIMKTALRVWTMSHEPEDRTVLKAKNYDAALREVNHKRNHPQATGRSQDQDAIANAIKRTWVTAQIVATPSGTWFTPEKPPDPNTGIAELHNYQVKGTEERFPGKEWA